MYHLLYTHHKTNECQLIHSLLKSSQEPPTEPESQEEPVYTVMGEPVAPEEETPPLTIVLDLHPTLYDDPAEQESQQSDEQEHADVPAHRKKIGPFGWMLMGVALALVGALMVRLLIPWFLPSATVTIVPLTQSVHLTITAQIVSGNANLAQQQMQGRQLAMLTMSQSTTVPTTGSGSQPAQAAQGEITLYNALPTSQIVPAGTLLIGQDGVQVTTDGTVTIPAANAPIEGQASVSAYATAPGPAGNIAALDINGPCCRANVTAKNPGAFTGGQNAKSFQAVSAQDIKGAATTLETRLTQDATASYQAEVQDDEGLITPVSCSAQVSADPPQGSEAEHVTVSVSEACQGTAYNAAQMHTLVSHALSQQARESHTGGYQLNSRSLHIQITPSSTRPGAVQVQAHGTLLYQWSEQQQHTLATLIAGKSESQATTLLARQPGISTTVIQFNGRNTDTLPADPSRIQFIFVRYGQ